ncbi:MAG TPA: serine hydrolase domain-containing protein [Gemmataceae bacterium]|nr:serine hydrolase domain-containing protein [Gemmataceae bacterium]
MTARSALVALLLVAAPASAHEPNAPAKVDALFAAWNKPTTPGLAVAIVRDGEVVYSKGFGSANLELAVPITPRTSFNIGSTSKQFTAFAILLLAKDGKLTLDDPVRKHVPEFPDFGKPLTVRHLLHPTRGLREDWSLLAMSGTRSEDVIRMPDILRLVSRQKELNFAPGSEYLYCNTGYDMLAEILKRASGKSLRAFARDRIFEPAGMKATEFCDDYRMLVTNKATSYRPRLGGGFEHSLFATERAGPSNLFTTVEDMARWVNHIDTLAKSDPELVAAMTRRGKLTDGTELTYAAGLMVTQYRGVNVIHHGGTTAGYRATLHRYPEHRLAVAIASNLSTASPDVLAAGVVDVYLGDKLAPKPAPKEAAKKAADPKRPAPKADELAALAGKYHSEELEVLYTATVRDGQLRIAHPKGECLLRATKTDEFQAFGGETVFETIAFTRNSAGAVTGFKISTSRARNVRFAKVEIKPAG